MKESSTPNPQIIKDKQIKLLGCVFFGNPFHEAKEWSYENEIGNLWIRFMNLTKQYKEYLEKISSRSTLGYELHLEPADYSKTNHYYVMVGIEIGEIEEEPLEFFTKSLPRTDYIEFTTQMSDKNEQGAYVYQTWMPHKKISQRYPYILQKYDSNRYRGLEDPSSEIDWLIPIQRNTQRGEKSE